jgi:hypothetical protein
LKNILGNTTRPVVPAWQQSNTMGDGDGLANTVVGEEQGGGVGEDPVSGDATATAAITTQTKGRKEKGKQKQTLFTLGSLAT